MKPGAEERLAVCSWSLRPTSAHDLCEKARACGIPRVQLHLDPIREGAWDEARTMGALLDSGVRVVSGMMAMAGEDYSTLESIARTGGVRPDATWSDNLRAAGGNAEIAARLGLGLVTFHAGFVPHDPEDPERATVIERTRAVAQAFRRRGVRTALETGQESALSLLSFLEEVNAGVPSGQRVGVNFDPANMILYGTGEPIDVLTRLMPQVVQVHVKDASPPERPGVWGVEKPAGEGAVDWSRFFAMVGANSAIANVVIEREGGEQRVADVRRAAALVRGHLGGEGA
jgi:L-ribulose-5-phosphate 3-epimerase